MPGVTIKVEGLKELRSSLKAIDAGLPKELNKVSKDAADLVSQTGQQMAPKLTGTLAGRVKPGATASGSYVAIRGLVYAPPIHWGWAKHNIKPNPFLYHALDARRDEVIDRFNNGVADLIDKHL